MNTTNLIEKQETVKQVKGQTTVIPPVATLRKKLSYGDDGSVTLAKGAEITPEELATVANDDRMGYESSRVRMANTLRLARNLPDVEVYGMKVKAFDATKDAFRKLAVSDAAFYSALGIVMVLDVRDANPGVLDHLAIQTIQDSMGDMKAWGILDTKTLKLADVPKVEDKPSEKGIALKRVLTDKANPAPTNALRETRAAIKKAAMDRLNAEKAEAEKLKTVVNGSVPNATPTHTPQTMKAALYSMVKQWELTCTTPEQVKECRSVCSDTVIAIAKLAGFSCATIK